MFLIIKFIHISSVFLTVANPHLQTVPPSPPLSGNVLIEGESDNDSIGSDLDLGTGPKDTFVIEVDDVSAEEVQPLLDGLPPTGVTVATTERLPGEDGQIGGEVLRFVHL